MKIINCSILFVLFYGFPLKAQKGCLPLPDSLGKVLAGVFLNKEDISKMPVFPDEKEMKIIEGIEGLGQPIAVAYGSVEAANFNQIKDSWKLLLHLAQTKKIGSTNTTYLRTYFEKNDFEFDHKKSDHYKLYTVFRHGVQNLALRFDLLWIKNKWLLINVDRDFYNYRGPTDAKNSFVQKGWDESVTLVGRPPAFATPTSVKKTGWSTGNVCMEDPATFIDQVLGQLANEQPLANYANLITAADFKKDYQPGIEKMINSAIKQQKNISGSELQELKDMQKILKDPAGLYKLYVADDIAKLTAYLKTVKYKPGNVKSKTYSITNYDYEVWSPGKIILQVDVETDNGSGEEGIRFQGTWLNNRWQLLSVQSTTVGYMKAE